MISTLQAALTLDFWQNSVSYQGRILPTGSLGCAALNISSAILDALDTQCAVLAALMGALNENTAAAPHLSQARRAALRITRLLAQTAPFSYLDGKAMTRLVEEAFTEEAMACAKAYAALLMAGVPADLRDDRFAPGVCLLRLLPVMEHLAYSLRQYQDAMLPFAKALQQPEQVRTADGYAKTFAVFFPPSWTLSAENSSWMAMANATVQYRAVQRSGDAPPQLVKEMHYVSFVGLLRSDLFEGLCLGHAPRRCPTCGRWFLTTNARPTKYCGGLAPEDPLGRTCRQVGNLQGRAKREKAPDHPLKQIYARRCNTIRCSVRRGKLNPDLAKAMKRLAKNKLLRALRDPAYAGSTYAAEMEQAALLEEAQRGLTSC